MIIFPMLPRFIISIRELYDCDLHRCWQGLDTGFGVLSHPVGSENTAVSAIASTWQGQGQVVVGNEDDSEAIQLEVLGDGTRHV